MNGLKFIIFMPIALLGCSASTISGNYSYTMPDKSVETMMFKNDGTVIVRITEPFATAKPLDAPAMNYEMNDNKITIHGNGDIHCDIGDGQKMNCDGQVLTKNG